MAKNMKIIYKDRKYITFALGHIVFHDSLALKLDSCLRTPRCYSSCFRDGYKKISRVQQNLQYQLYR